MTLYKKRIQEIKPATWIQEYNSDYGIKGLYFYWCFLFWIKLIRYGWPFQLIWKSTNFQTFFGQNISEMNIILSECFLQNSGDKTSGKSCIFCWRREPFLQTTINAIKVYYYWNCIKFNGWIYFWIYHCKTEMLCHSS